jgi:hypothetical protein
MGMIPEAIFPKREAGSRKRKKTGGEPGDRDDALPP